MKLLLYILLLITLPSDVEARQESEFSPKEVIFGHLDDKYEWIVPLPVIVRNRAGEWSLFYSSRLRDGAEYNGYRISDAEPYAGKIVATDAQGAVYRPLDLSVTKNVVALWLGIAVVLLSIFSLVRWYRHHPLSPPRRGLGLMEKLVEMVYAEVIVPILGERTKRYAPYLLTVFFFILFVNLLGMIVVFPGGVNVMGNISVTLVLALCTFVVVNLSGTRHYWREIFWPEVPLWLKFPLPMMPLIELFGVFTKPIALMIRLFANMLAGHLITLVLVSIIFLFGAYGTLVISGATVLSVAFNVFMGLLDLLIGFIQAYVFMMLSAIFISLSNTKTKSLC